MVQKKYSVLIIGAGNIAAGYDEPEDSHVLTHAHAITKNPHMECIGFFDVRQEQAVQAAKKWKLPVIESLQAALNQKPDVVVICSPDHVHRENLETVALAAPRFILCEKPLTLRLTESMAVTDLLRKKNIPFLVNYQRRFDSTVLDIKRKIYDGSFGKVVGGNVSYSKGILHNGSHAINLLLFLFGKPTGFTAAQRKLDFYQHDPSVDAILVFDSFVLHLTAGDEKKFSIFEIDLIFEKARIRFMSSGNTFDSFNVVADPIFPAFKELRIDASGPTELRTALIEVYKTIVSVLDGADRDLYVDDAIQTQLICEKMANAELFQHIKF